MEGLNFEPVDTTGFKLFYKETPIFELHRPSVEFFEGQLPLVQGWAELRDERSLEILAQIDNQTAFIAAVTGLNPERHRWTFEWLNIALSLVIPVEVRFKHALGCHRPVEYSPQIQPIITTPGHGTYPMGHAAQAYMLAYVIQRLFKLVPKNPLTVQLQQQAARFSINRVIAGVHFPVDAIVGQGLGQTMAELFLWRCGFNEKLIYRRYINFENLSKKEAENYDFPNSNCTPEKYVFHEYELDNTNLNNMLKAFTALALNECRGPIFRI